MTPSDKHTALMADIEVEKESDNELSDSGSERSSKFDFGPPLLFSGDSVDMDSLPENIKSRVETITIRRQMVGKLGKLSDVAGAHSWLFKSAFLLSVVKLKRG